MDSVLQSAIYPLRPCGVSVSITSNKIVVQGSNFSCVPYISPKGGIPPFFVVCGLTLA